MSEKFLQHPSVFGFLVTPPSHVCPLSVPAGEIALQPKNLFDSFETSIQSMCPTLRAEVAVLEFFVEHDTQLCGNDRKVEPDVTLHVIGDGSAIEGNQEFGSLEHLHQIG
jgi:hypothetical protein